MEGNHFIYLQYIYLVYPDGYIEEAYWIIHVSLETYKKKRDAK